MKSNLVQCPYCGGEIFDRISEWNYRYGYYHVVRLECKKCSMLFMVYYHNDKFSHTIPKDLDIEAKITRYLKKHQPVTEEAMAKRLGLYLKDVSTALQKLEKKGALKKEPNQS